MSDDVKVESEVEPGNAPPADPPTQPAAAEVKIEEIVTPEILSAILKNYDGEGTWELVDWEGKLGTVAGDNYMSLIYAVKIVLKKNSSGACGGDKTQVLPVMLKVLPRNEMRVKHINEANIFVKDVSMYDKIIPAIEQFQRKTLSEQEVCTPWPKCYASKVDGKDDFLAMEDLKAQGFKMASRKIGLDFEHCKLVLQTMAKFHALSFAMFNGDRDKMLEKYDWLEDGMFTEDKVPEVWKDMISHTYAQQAIKLREVGDELGAHLLDHIYSDDYFSKLHELVGGKARWPVVGHGDCWTNNILFRYDEETNKPVEVKFVDFQVSRVASFAVDFHYFIHSSPQTNVLNDRESDLKQVYFNEFTEFSNKLGVDTQGQYELTKENFDKEIERVRFYGVVSGFMLALFTSADAEDVPEMESIKEEDLLNTEDGKNFFLNMMKDKAIVKIRNLAGVHLPKCKEMQKYLPKEQENI